MATTPTVEFCLGGSIRSQAASHFTGYEYWQMSSYPETFAIWDYNVPSSGVLAPTGDDATSYPVSQGTLRGFGGLTTNVVSVLPEIATAITTDGTTGYMTSAGVPLYPNLGPLSIEAVLKINATPGVGIEPHIWGNENFGLTYKNDGRVYAYYNGSSTSNVAVATGSTVHLVLTRSGASPDSVKLYVNGSASTATPARATIYTADMWAGRHRTNATHFLGATYYFLAVYGGELSAANVSAHYAALSWTAVTTDTLGAAGLTYERGIRDDKPNNRVASTGTLTFSMNNLGSNSGGVTGYYSPGHASCRAGFGKGTPVRVKTGSDVQFIGRIRAIAPSPGKTGTGTKVLATDFMDQAATFLLENAPILEDVTGDEVFTQIVGLMTNQPAGVITYPGTETYTLALDNTRDEAVTALEEFHRLAISELGYIYQKRTGELVYEARGTRVTNATTASITLNNTMHAIDVAEVSSTSINRVQITVHPREIDAAATTVLFELTNPLQIAAFESKTIMGPYRTSASPGITTRVGGLDMVTPVATTDYTMNTASDGSGGDLTSYLTVTANYGPNGVQFVLLNTAGESAYITKLQARGKGVYDFRTVVIRDQDDAAVASDGVNALTLDMVYQENPNVAASIAQSLRSAYGDLSGTRARNVGVYADDPGAPSGVVTADISVRVAVSESTTGATGQYYINGVKHEFKNGTLAKVTWWLTPAEPVSYWILGVSGASELGTTTFLAPG